MPWLGWRVHFTRRLLQQPSEPRDSLAGIDIEGIGEWLDAQSLSEGSPSLFAPDGAYDLELNRYFENSAVRFRSPHTAAAAAYDLADFLTFVWQHRPPIGGGSWKDATPADRAAYLYWRRKDPEGPRVAGSTWSRSVATVNAFYTWAVGQGYVAVNPILQREVKSRPGRRGAQGGQTPAEAARDRSRPDTRWFPPETYRTWRDVGVRGYASTGIPASSFKGRNASRNAAFCDLMIRTGLRLEEQASLTVFDLPDPDPSSSMRPMRLPSAIAKGGSGRRVYIPSNVLKDVWDYVRFERADAVARAARRDAYGGVGNTLIVEDRNYPTVPSVGGRSRAVPVELLKPDERRRLFIRSSGGLEPASLWLSQAGSPLGREAWQGVFQEANERCERHGLKLSCHPHMLRHSYAVITLELLQREHIRELAESTVAQRHSYEMIFGDPLDWVRRRLGHRSVESTFIYLHTLQELEMETRMALVPADWETTMNDGLEEMRAGDELDAGLDVAGSQ
jgi:site-specific recombinase XerD